MWLGRDLIPRILNADFYNDRDELIETVERVVEELPDDST